MKNEDIYVGMRVRISEGHRSGYEGRIGYVVEMPGRYRIEGSEQPRHGVLVDIGEPLLLVVESEYLEPAPLPDDGYWETEV